MIISKESIDFDDPKELDDPQLFHDPSYLMIPSLFHIDQAIRNCGHFLLTILAQSSKFSVTQKFSLKNIKKSSNLVHFCPEQTQSGV